MSQRGLLLARNLQGMSRSNKDSMHTTETKLMDRGLPEGHGALVQWEAQLLRSDKLRVVQGKPSKGRVMSV